jgi:chromate transport protein ChrA
MLSGPEAQQLAIYIGWRLHGFPGGLIAGWFFTKAAFVTIGGAYAVLSYMADQAVNFCHWITTAEMVQGLGLADRRPAR